MTKGKSGDGPCRSAVSGQYVTPAQGRVQPRTTVHESPGAGGSSGEHYRSAISGRYVTNAHGRRGPKTAVREK